MSSSEEALSVRRRRAHESDDAHISSPTMTSSLLPNTSKEPMQMKLKIQSTNDVHNTMSQGCPKGDGQYAGMLSSFRHGSLRRAAIIISISYKRMCQNHKLLSFITCTLLFLLINVRMIYIHLINDKDSTMTSETKSAFLQNQRYDIPINHLNGTVIGVGDGYQLSTYQRYIGSLRSSGFEGRIVVGMAPPSMVDSSPIYRYLQSQQVTVKPLAMIPCQEENDERRNDVDGANDHSNTKVEGRHLCYRSGTSVYPTLVDWMMEEDMGRTILISTISNIYFQRDPFQVLNAEIDEEFLYFYEQDESSTTESLRAAAPLHVCKSFQWWDVPLLSSNIIVGDSSSVLSYLKTMKNEIDELRNDPDRCSSLNAHQGIGTSIHNYIFYDGKIRAKAFQARFGLVHSVTKEEELEYDQTKSQEAK